MARTSCKRNSRLTGRKGPNVVGNLHTAIQSPRVKPEGDRGKKMILSLPGFFSFSSFPGLTGESVREMSGSRPNMTEREKRPNMTKKIQGTASRYSHRKHRASTKVPAAASAAVKLATACALQQRFAPQPASAQGRPLVKLATACVIRFFKNLGE